MRLMIAIISVFLLLAFHSWLIGEPTDCIPKKTYLEEIEKYGDIIDQAWEDEHQMIDDFQAFVKSARACVAASRGQNCLDEALRSLASVRRLGPID